MTRNSSTTILETERTWDCNVKLNQIGSRKSSVAIPAGAFYFLLLLSPAATPVDSFRVL